MGFLKKLFGFLTDDDMITGSDDEVLFNVKSHAVLFSPSDQFPVHKDLILYFLNLFDQGAYEFITFTNADEPSQYVRVEYGDKVDITVQYPFKDDPENKMKTLDVVFPESYNLVGWKPGACAMFNGSRISKEQVADLVKTLFINLLGATSGFILSGTID